MAFLLHFFHQVLQLMKLHHIPKGVQVKDQVEFETFKNDVTKL